MKRRVVSTFLSSQEVTTTGTFPNTTEPEGGFAIVVVGGPESLLSMHELKVKNNHPVNVRREIV
jgi:hypothetical protein